MDLRERAERCRERARACRRGAVSPSAVEAELRDLLGTANRFKFWGCGLDEYGRPWSERVTNLERAVRKAAAAADADPAALDAALARCEAELAPLAGADEPEPAGAW